MAYYLMAMFSEYHLFVIPLLAGTIGWLTNYLAIRMLFRPHKRKRFLFWHLQGLIPMRRKEIAEKIADAIGEHLLDQKTLKEFLDGVANISSYNKIIAGRLDNFFYYRLADIHPMVEAFMTEDLKQKIKGHLVVEIRSGLLDVQDVFQRDLLNRLNIKKVVYERIMGYDFQKFEKIILSIASNELQTIEFLGAILGFSIGLLQVAFLYP